MRQRITFIRTTTTIVDLDYPVDPHTKANAEYWANHAFEGTSPLDLPKVPGLVKSTTTNWVVKKSEPPVTPAGDR